MPHRLNVPSAPNTHMLPCGHLHMHDPSNTAPAHTHELPLYAQCPYTRCHPMQPLCTHRLCPHTLPLYTHCHPVQPLYIHPYCLTAPTALVPSVHPKPVYPKACALFLLPKPQLHHSAYKPWSSPALALPSAHVLCQPQCHGGQVTLTPVPGDAQQSHGDQCWALMEALASSSRSSQPGEEGTEGCSSP